MAPCMGSTHTGNGVCHGPSMALPTLPRQAGISQPCCTTAGTNTDTTRHLLGGAGRDTVWPAKRNQGLRPEANTILHPGHAPNPRESGKGGTDPSPASTASESRRSASEPEKEQSERKERKRKQARSETQLPRQGKPLPHQPPRPLYRQGAPLAALPPHREPPSPLGARSEAPSTSPRRRQPPRTLTALRAGYAVGGDSSSRRRSSRCGGRDMLGRRLFIAAGSGAAQLWGAAAPPPAPPRMPRPQRSGGRAGPQSAGPAVGGCPPASSLPPPGVGRLAGRPGAAGGAVL